MRSTTSSAAGSRTRAWSPAAPRPTSAWSRSIELPDHPFFVASQFHPEFNSRPTRPEPLFREFVGAAARARGGTAAGEADEPEAEAADRRRGRRRPPLRLSRAGAHSLPRESMERGEAVVREVWSRWNSGDRDIDERLIDPDCEVHSALAQRVYRGPDEVREWMGEIDDQFDDWDLSIDEVSAIDADRLLVAEGSDGRGRKSGIDLDEPAAWIIGMRGERMWNIRNFIGRDALEQARSEAAVTEK